MERKNLTHFYRSVKSCNPSQPWDVSLQIYNDEKLAVYYAPFEHINRKAKVVICGITPGKTQAMEALNIAKGGLISGTTLSTIQEQAKLSASFKGFRKNLSAMLDLVGLNEKMGIETCNDLFGIRSNLVHNTSAIRYPVVLSNGNNYNGTPKPHRHNYLRAMIETYLAEEVESLGPDCLWIPLGGTSTEALNHLVDIGVLRANQLLAGLPHPSGANAERVAYFLGNKPKDALSNRVNPDIIDSAKAELIRKLNRK